MGTERFENPNGTTKTVKPSIVTDITDIIAVLAALMAIASILFGIAKHVWALARILALLFALIAIGAFFIARRAQAATS
jgi:hypothetical protein